ncbi:hypothetical protein ABZ618_23635 [Streptomyces roseolus]|uniref:hypothetical protein n=1 Tax=Streptomyces roseolus TaxID=67358 RepID=UPI0033E911A3
MRNLIVALLARLLSALTADPRDAQAGTPTTAPAPALRAGECRPRSPYVLTDPLTGESTALVRPYLLAHERQEERAARQLWRRVSLVLAADLGIDLDTRDVHAAGARAW